MFMELASGKGRKASLEVMPEDNQYEQVAKSWMAQAYEAGDRADLLERKLARALKAMRWRSSARLEAIAIEIEGMT